MHLIPLVKISIFSLAAHKTSTNHPTSLPPILPPFSCLPWEKERRLSSLPGAHALSTPTAHHNPTPQALCAARGSERDLRARRDLRHHNETWAQIAVSQGVLERSGSSPAAPSPRPGDIPGTPLRLPRVQGPPAPPGGALAPPRALRGRSLVAAVTKAPPRGQGGDTGKGGHGKGGTRGWERLESHRAARAPTVLRGKWVPITLQKGIVTAKWHRNGRATR